MAPVDSPATRAAVRRAMDLVLMNLPPCAKCSRMLDAGRADRDEWARAIVDMTFYDGAGLAGPMRQIEAMTGRKIADTITLSDPATMWDQYDHDSAERKGGGA